MFVNASALAEGSVVRADVCIVGSGPAGLVMARRLARAGRSVVVLESGQFATSVRAQQLNRGGLGGRETWPLHKSRFRIFGGSGTRWGGWCRPLDPADLQQRDWVPGSGWPVDHADLAPYLDQAASELLVEPAVDAAVPPLPGFDLVGYDVSRLSWTVGQHFRDEMGASGLVTVLLGATATDVRLAPGTSRVERVEVATQGGKLGPKLGVVAREYVLAAGGIENARLLLTSHHDRAGGLGNEHDLVGRCFMEHLQGQVGHLLLRPGLARTPLFTALADEGLDTRRRWALAGPAEVTVRERLLAMSMMVTPAPHQFWHPLINLPTPVSMVGERFRHRLLTGSVAEPTSAHRARLVDAQLRLARQQARAVALYPEVRRLRRLAASHGMPGAEVRSVYVRAEQSPQRSSRVRLGAGRDRFGVRQVDLDWRVAPSDIASVERWVELLGRSLADRDGVELLPDPGWADAIEGGPHHMGTTRMSISPRNGVVDEHGRVHTVDNLHVAGSSVFPTGGYANPTLTLVALTLRLADRLVTRAVDRVVRATEPLALT